MRNHFLDKPVLYQWAMDLTRSLPRPALYALARFIGAAAYALSPTDRDNIGCNLALIQNGSDNASSSHAARREMLWRLFQNYALYIVDFFRLLGMDAEASSAFAHLHEGREHLDAALALGRGVILLTAHLGHWEIGGLGLRALGYPVNVVAIRHNSFLTNELINTLRSRHGIRVIELGDSAYNGIEIVRALQRKEIVAVLGDRVFPADRAAQASLFGRPTALPLGPLYMAMATGAPVVPAFSVMEGTGKYRGFIEPALHLRNGPDREASLQANLRQIAAVFEKYIRLYPDQWYHFERL